ncbi:hypothetical protein DFP72DRAFT_1065238 [Ephemerocybe angulata]|uniref:Uncharacterized protein n=1 Tax=Ephemerocybe angulata TaxID=980116 RepID=A0A8H6I3I1_9AGAR|nr:hypothetical protein DFP72DRAFT_1065238 [Tulosesus angulatus]
MPPDRRTPFLQFQTRPGDRSKKHLASNSSIVPSLSLAFTDPTTIPTDSAWPPFGSSFNSTSGSCAQNPFGGDQPPTTNTTNPPSFDLEPVDEGRGPVNAFYDLAHPSGTTQSFWPTTTNFLPPDRLDYSLNGGDEGALAEPNLGLPVTRPFATNAPTSSTDPGFFSNSQNFRVDNFEYNVYNQGPNPVT